MTRHPLITAGALLLIVLALALPDRTPQACPIARHAFGLEVGP